jgi:hypothetical protein
MKVAWLSAFLVATAIAGFRESTRPAPPICMQVVLRNGATSWFGRFAFDTVGLLKDDQRLTVAADTFGNVPRGHWRLQSNDSLWINIGFVDGGFEILLSSLFRDSVSGRAVEWSTNRSVPWSAYATRSRCPSVDSLRGLPPARLIVVRPPA